MLRASSDFFASGLQFMVSVTGGAAWARLQIVLAREASLVDGAALAALEHDLEEPHAGVDEERPPRHVRHLEHLASGDARLHEARGDVDHEAEAREPATALEPSANVAGKC